MTIAAGRTHPGRARQSNEDAFLVDSLLNLLVVADGMGGHLGGEVASAIAIRSVHDFVRASRDDGGITWPYGIEPKQSFEANQLRNGVYVAHRQIQAEGGRRSDLHDMGSTIVAVLLGDGRVASVNVGDSRLYLFRAGALVQLSVDHSWAASAIQSGADPADVNARGMGHLLTHALGIEHRLDVPVRDAALEHGDLLLLCTDGLYRVIGDEAIARALSDARLDVQAQADRLIDLANEAGGPDNITAVVARYDEDVDRPLKEPAA